MVSGEIDLENVAKDAAFTAFTAGVDIGGVQFDGVNSYAGSYADTLGLSRQSTLGPRAGDLLSSHSITTGLIGATATGAVQTGLYGGSLGNNILDNAESFAANQAMAVGFYDAGEFKSINNLTDGSAGGIAAHMLAGCAGGALTGVGCGEGAAAAGVNEFAAGHGWGSDTVKFTNMGTVALLSHGDPTALGQLSGITATADPYNRQLHKIEDERLTKLKAGKTEEEQRRLDEAACYIIRCADGIPIDDPNYETSAAMQKAGAEHQAEIKLIQGQSRERDVLWIARQMSPAIYYETLFAYTGTDEWIDRNLQNRNLVRAGGVLMAVGGMAEGTTGYLSCLRGTCTVASGAAIAQGGDYLAAGSIQAWHGEPVTPLGEQALQGFGLSPEMTASLYGATAIGAEGAAALRVGVTTAAINGAKIAGGSGVRTIDDHVSDVIAPPFPAKLTSDGKSFAGHGKISANPDGTLPMVTVPKGTYVTVPIGPNRSLRDSADQLIESGDVAGGITQQSYRDHYQFGIDRTDGAVTYLPGAEMPNYTLYPPDWKINVLPGSKTVKEPSALSDLLDQNMGCVNWAACTEVEGININPGSGGYDP